MRRRVVVIQRILPHYRVPFFNLLRELLQERGVDLELIVGQAAIWESSKNDEGSLPWAKIVKNRYIKFGNRHVVWQPVWAATRGADLVVVEQASRLLVNYPLLFGRRFGGPKIASWGHGRNLNLPAGSRLGETLKRRLLGMSEWWFAYTAGTADLLQAAGVPSSQIVILQNAIDTKSLAEQRASVTPDEVAALRYELGIDSRAKVGLVLGSIYSEKRPTFVVNSADFIKQAMPDFHLIVAGDGPLRSVFDGASATRPWMHVLGNVTGSILTKYAAVSSVILNPGLVGLSVVDAFALSLPMVTCSLTYHSPEFSYLVNGENGIVTQPGANEEQFAHSVVELLRDPESLALMSAMSAASSRIYTLEAMAENYALGVCLALSDSARGSLDTNRQT